MRLKDVNTYMRLRRLVVEATNALGPRRVSLCAGCSISTVNGWLIREKAELRRGTLQRTLPRLENWRDWIPGYRAGQQEFDLLTTANVTWHSVCGELHHRLDQASETLTPEQLSLGCEVPVQRIMEWRLGIFQQQHVEQVLKALAHLRHVHEWSVPAVRPMADHKAASLA